MNNCEICNTFIKDKEYYLDDLAVCEECYEHTKMEG